MPRKEIPAPKPATAKKILAILDPAFLYGEPDPSLFREFLNLAKDAEIDYGRPRPPGLDAREWVQQLQEEGRRANENREELRNAILGSMNLKTLIETAVAMEVPKNEAIFGVTNSDNPATMAVVRCIRQSLPMQGMGPITLDGAIATELEVALSEFDKQTDLPRPNLPCSLEAALRYLANEPSVPPELLELAYIEWLLVRSSPVDDKIRFEEYLLRERLKNLTPIPNPPNAAKSKIKNLEKNRRLGPKVRGDDPFAALENSGTTPTEFQAGTGEGGARARKRRAEAFESCRKQLQDFDMIRDIRLNFRPGKSRNVPRFRKLAIQKAGKVVFGRRCVDGAIMLQLARSGFQSFWQTHCKAYGELGDEYVAQRKVVKATKKKAGSTGPDVREGDVWRERTRTFCETLTSCDISPESSQSDLEQFAREHLKLKNQPAIARAGLFFSTLLRYAIKKPTPAIAEVAIRDLNLTLDSSEARADERVTDKHGTPPETAVGVQVLTRSRLTGRQSTPTINKRNAEQITKNKKNSDSAELEQAFRGAEKEERDAHERDEGRQLRERSRRAKLFKSVTSEIVLDSLNQIHNALSRRSRRER